MPYIKVDHSRFAAAAEAVEDYRDLLKNKMDQGTTEVRLLAAQWQGADYTQFKNKWDTLNDSGSVYAKMRTELKNYADFLRFAGEKYKEAQINAYNRAKNLPKW